MDPDPNGKMFIIVTYMIMEAWISQDFLQIVPFSAQIVQNNL